MVGWAVHTTCTQECAGTPRAPCCRRFATTVRTCPYPPLLLWLRALTLGLPALWLWPSFLPCPPNPRALTGGGHDFGAHSAAAKVAEPHRSLRGAVQQPARHALQGRQAPWVGAGGTLPARCGRSTSASRGLRAADALPAAPWL